MKFLLLLFVGVILNENCANAVQIDTDDQIIGQTVPINEKEIDVKTNSASISDNKKELIISENENDLERIKRASSENHQALKSKQKRGKNVRGRKNGKVQKDQKYSVIGKVGAAIVFYLTIMSYLQPVFLALMPTHQQHVEYNVSFHGGSKNVPPPMKYSRADLKQLQMECTPTGSKHRKMLRDFVWKCSTKVEMDMSDEEYKFVASMENDPEKLIELDDFNVSSSCQRDINLQNDVQEKSCHKIMKITKNDVDELEKDNKTGNGAVAGGARRKLLQSNIIDYKNVDILSDYANYGIKLQEYSNENVIIHYPALEKSIKYAKEKKLKPCDNFYNYVCEGFGKTLKESMTKLNRTFDTNSDVHNFILVDQIEQFWLSHFTKPELRNKFPENDASKNMLKFYDKCVKHKSENDEFKDLLVNQFNLNYLKETNSTPEMLEFNTEFIIRTHPFNPFFSIERIAAKKTDPKTGKVFEGHQFRLQFLDSVMDPDSVVLYQNSMKSTGITGRKAGLTKKENDKIQKKLLEIAKEITPLRENIQIDGIDNKNAYKTTLGKYTKTFGMEGKIDWLKIMQKIYPNANVTKADTLILYYPNTFIKYSEAMRKYSKSKSEIDKQAMSEYLLWNLIDSVKIVNLDSFASMQCIKGCYDYFPHPMSELLFKETKINEEQRNGAKEIYEMVRDQGYMKMFEKSSWMKKKHKEYALNKLGHITTTIGLDSEIPEKDAIIKEMYKTYNLSEEMNWLEMMVQVRRAKKQIFPTREIEYSDSSDYFNLWNQINIGGGNLLLPVYNNVFPAAYKFGYLASLFGHEQAHSLQPLNEEFDRLENGTYGPRFWSKPYLQQYKQRQNCFVKQYKKMHQIYYKKLPIYDTVIEDTADEVGIKAMLKAFEAFKQRYPDKVNEQLFGGELADIPADQLPFIARAFPFCPSHRDDPTWNPTDKAFSHSPAQMRVNLPLMNSPEFAEAFKCQKGDAMFLSPEEQCHLYN